MAATFHDVGDLLLYDHTMGRAEDIYSRLQREGVAAIAELIADAQAENLWLDFKRSCSDGKGRKLHENDWKNLAKALSGFSNFDGGVILWGVDCNSDPVLGDVPTGTSPLENPARFVSWLENAVSACTVPAVPGVENLAIGSDAGAGFVATYVPASAFAPHQCVRPAGVQQYYIRAGSSFVTTPHAVLAGLFGRRPQAEVFQTYRAKATANTKVLQLDVTIHIHNAGPAIARDVFVNLLLGIPGGVSSGAIFPDPDNSGNWETHMQFGVQASAIAKPGYRLAPGGFWSVFRVKIELAEPFDGPYGFRVTVGCDGSPMHVTDVRYEPDELEKKYLSSLGALLKKSGEAQEDVIHAFIGG